ncbi:MAG: DUF2291 domain-containing protein [Desulfobacteraceae bacterium]|nr:MAG: DUF2291 domain-containing protein [Desulfobacteraceae bacterium]
MLNTSTTGSRFIARIFLTLCLFFLVINACTIVPDDDTQNGSQGKSGEKEKLDIYFVSDDFKPDEYARNIWKSKVVPLFMEKSTPLEQILPDWHQNSAEAGRKFGYREKAEGSPWNFRVRGKGIILAAHTTSRASTVDIDLFPADGTPDLVLQIGPVFKDSAIRDSLDFISFTDFTNQLEFARLSNAFNKVVRQDVTGNLDRENLKGRQVSFWGAFTQLQDSDQIRVTPVVLTIE